METKNMKKIFKTSDTDLMRIASSLIKREDYIKIREEYKMSKPLTITRETHRRIILNAQAMAKMVIDGGGTKDEVRRACEYYYICMDAMKYNLRWHAYVKKNRIDDLSQKYCAQKENPTE